MNRYRQVNPVPTASFQQHIHTLCIEGGIHLGFALAPEEDSADDIYTADQSLPLKPMATESGPCALSIDCSLAPSSTPQINTE